MKNIKLGHVLCFYMHRKILADQKAPPGSSGAPHYYMPPQIFRLCDMPALLKSVKVKVI